MRTKTNVDIFKNLPVTVIANAVKCASSGTFGRKIIIGKYKRSPKRL